MRSHLVRNLLIACLIGLGLSLSMMAQQPLKKVACIGNSVTAGLLLQDPATEAYPAQLQALLGNGYEVKNFGHSGATLLREGHNPYAKTKEYQAAIAYPADIAVIHLGLNDTDPRNFPHYRDRFRGDYLWLIDQLRKNNPHLEVYICSMTPIFPGHPRFTSSTLEWHQLLQQEIEKVVKASGAHFIDLYQAFQHRPDLITDPPTLHPNKEGAALLAKVAYQHLTGDFGGLRLDPLWGSHMVLQQNSHIPLTGHADAHAPITAYWNGETLTTTTREDGTWQLMLTTPQGSRAKYSLRVTDDKKVLHLEDILIGEVWLAMGQSNMEFPLKSMKDGQVLASTADPDRMLRLYHMQPKAVTNNAAWSDEALTAANQLNFYHGEWSVDTQEAAEPFSAIGYSFGRRLEEELDVPVGIIELAVGGSPLLSWVSREALYSDPYFHDAFVGWRESDYIMRWCRERATTNLGKEAKNKFQRHAYEPAFNHEAGRSQLGSMPVAGVLWYQGESDAENAELYKRLFPLLVKDLRQQHGCKTPLYTVQLSSIERVSWPWFRWYQAESARQLDEVYLAISHDYGDAHDVHPTDKRPIAERLVALALQHNYGKEVVADSPIPSTLRAIDQHTWQIDFAPCQGVLSTTDGSSEVKGVELMTFGGKRIPLKATISKDRKSLLIELHAEIAEGEIIYAWDAVVSSDANLCYEGAQPAGSFRLPIPTAPLQ